MIRLPIVLSTMKSMTRSCVAPFSAKSINNEVITEEFGEVAIMTMNRVGALNSLSLPMCIQMRETLEDLMERNIKCIILKGAGSKAFCAGGDVKSIALEKGPFTPGKPGSLRSDFFREEYKLDYAFSNAKGFGLMNDKLGKISQVSLWDGIVMGGGVGVSVHGSFRVATNNTLFAMPETAIGIFPDVGSSYVLSRLPGGIGLYLGLLGVRLHATDLLYSGLATHYVSSDRLSLLEEAIVASNGREIAGVLREFSSSPKSEVSILEENRDAIDRCFYKKQRVQDIVDALHKEETDWSREALKLMSKQSPTSLKLTHRQISRGRSLTLRGCFEMEFRMMQRAVRSHDFVEGVRAMLIDKDQAPKWIPHSLNEVNDSDLEHFFDPLAPYELDLPH